MPSDTVKDVLNGFPGRVVLMMLTTITSIFSAIGTVYIKNLHGYLNLIKSEASNLSIHSKLVDSKKIDSALYTQDQSIMRERIHVMDVRMIKLEESIKAASDSLTRIERRLEEQYQTHRRQPE
jgi:hypothetical protein